ncbi:gfa-like protein [alpha proteobacterium U9-1i]|nr:gfa-like protein [alpha proteobacterium U9-1i]
MSEAKTARAVKKPKGLTAKGACLCGAVELEIGIPAFWAWHDHSASSRRAHGAAYATYVGCWRSKLRVAKGAKAITRFEQSGGARSFCAKCGTPLMYERAGSPKMVNVPRALFTTRTGREPLYHIGIEEMQDWAYTGERLTPLKGYPGVVWTGGRRKRGETVEML